MNEKVGVVVICKGVSDLLHFLRGQSSSGLDVFFQVKPFALMLDPQCGDLSVFPLGVGFNLLLLFFLLTLRSRFHAMLWHVTLESLAPSFGRGRGEGFLLFVLVGVVLVGQDLVFFFRVFLRSLLLLNPFLQVLGIYDFDLP